MSFDITPEDMARLLTLEDWQKMEQQWTSRGCPKFSFEPTEFDPLLSGAGSPIHGLQTDGSEEDFVMVDDFGNPIGYIGLPSEPPAGSPGVQLPTPTNTNAAMANTNASHQTPTMENDYCLPLLNSGTSQTTFDNADFAQLAELGNSNPRSTQSLSPTTNQALFGALSPTKYFGQFYSELPTMVQQQQAQPIQHAARSQRQGSCSAQGLSLPTPATTVASPACRLALPQPAESSPAWSQANEETPLLLQDFHSAMYPSPQGIKRPSSPEADLPQPFEPTNRIKKPKIHHPDSTKEGRDLQKRCESGQIEMTGLICKSKEDFDKMYEKTESFYRKPLECCTYPSNDPTFPCTDEDYCNYVLLLKSSIMSWESFIEWRQTLNKSDKAEKTRLQVVMVEDHEADKRRGVYNHNALTVEDLLPSLQDRGMYLQDVPKMHSHVLGRLCNDWCAESYSWQLLEAAIKAQKGIAMSMPWTTNDGHWEAYRSLGERVNMIAHVLRNSKQVLKSIMCIGDGWVQRVANNPSAELNGKVDNMRCNLKKNRNVRQTARKQREDTES